MLFDKRYEEPKWVSTMHRLFAPGRPEVNLDPKHSALFIVDMQKGFCLPEHAPVLRTLKEIAPEDFDFWMERLKVIVPNLRRLQGFFRRNGMEVVQCVGSGLTQDGRDRPSSGVAKGRNISFAPGSVQTEVLDELKPEPNELLVTKTTGSAFAGYGNTYWVLKNMGIDYLVFGGMVTDGCVQATVTSAKDLLGGDKVIIVEDCCSAYSEEGHINAIKQMGGSATIASTDAVIEHLREQLRARELPVK